MAVPAESAGQQLGRSLLTIVLNTCEVNLAFMIEHGVAGVRWICSYVICKQIM